MIKPFLSNKLSLIAILLTSIWIVSDISSRLLFSSKTQNNTLIETDIPPLTLPQLTLSTVKKLNLAFENYKIDESVTETTPGMSAQEQEQQAGELKSFFIGENELQLKAVISQANESKQQESSQKIALVLVTNLKTGKSKVERYYNQNIIHGYTLTIDKNTQVSFAKQLTNRIQQVTLTMYKKRG